jgi:hypothetical protein
LVDGRCDVNRVLEAGHCVSTRSSTRTTQSSSRRKPLREGSVDYPLLAR